MDRGSSRHEPNYDDIWFRAAILVDSRRSRDGDMSSVQIRQLRMFRIAAGVGSSDDLSFPKSPSLAVVEQAGIVRS